MDPAKVLGHEFQQTEFSFSERDVSLYALSIGAANNKTKINEELPFVNCQSFSEGINLKTFPTFAVIFPGSLIDQFLTLDGLEFDPLQLLHGEQHLELFGELSTSARVRNESKVVNLEDKGKSALIEVETVSYDSNTGSKIAVNRSVCFLRGAGGFSKSEARPAHITNPTRKSTAAIPKGVAPTFSQIEQTQESQALLYRLNGDYNPLHSDPEVANLAGFERPILHGLCTLGFAARAVVSKCCATPGASLKAISVRFLQPVYPGETLVTQIWQIQPNKTLTFQSSVVERGVLVLQGTAEIHLASKL